MTLTELEEICKHGKVGLFPHYKGYFKWNYGYKRLDYENYEGERFPATELKDWNKIKETNNFYYII